MAKQPMAIVIFTNAMCMQSNNRLLPGAKHREEDPTVDRAAVVNQ
jgi:hypothetical protein